MTLRVSVAIALPERQDVVQVSLPDGSRVEDALNAAGFPERFPAIDSAAAQWGIWGRAASPGTVLRDGDRVELLRPLRADAKGRRRERARLSPSSRKSRSAP